MKSNNKNIINTAINSSQFRLEMPQFSYQWITNNHVTLIDNKFTPLITVTRTQICLTFICQSVVISSLSVVEHVWSQHWVIEWVEQSSLLIDIWWGNSKLVHRASSLRDTVHWPRTRWQRHIRMRRRRRYSGRNSYHTAIRWHPKWTSYYLISHLKLI